MAISINVRWAGSLSDPNRLQCGVRQGGLLLPILTNLYRDRLVREVSSIMGVDEAAGKTT